MTINDVIATVADHESNIEELAVDAALRLENGDTLLIDESQYRLEGDGLRRFCEQLSAPPGYMKDLPAQVRQPVLQHHLDCCDIGSEELTLIVREGQFLAFGRRDLACLNSRDVLEAVQAGTSCDLEVHDLQVRDGAFQADLLVEQASEEVAPGDIVRAGLRVTHSMIGEHATWIESFMHRLVCKNGLTHRDCVDRRAARTRRLPIEHRDARKLQIDQVRRLAAETSGTLRQKLDAIRALRQEKVEINPLMSRFLERGGMSTRLWLPILREAWEVEGSEATAFGVMNAMTRVATHRRELSPRHRRVLGGLAGILAFRQQHFCPRCFSQLRGPVGGAAADLN